MSTARRNTAAKLATTDWPAALARARAITDPWFLCQALSYVAFHAPDAATREALLAESFAAADALGQPNRVVSVSAWPLKVAATYWPLERVQREVARQLGIIAREPSPVRRANGLLHTIDALLRCPGAIEPVLRAFVDACFAPLLQGRRNKRGEAYLSHTVHVLACLDPAWARACCERIQGPNHRARALESLRQADGLGFEDLQEAGNLPHHCRQQSGTTP